MRLRYFVFDNRGTLHLTHRPLVERVWSGRAGVDRFSFEVGDSLRIITALCDDQLVPQVIFLLRLALDGGSVGDEARRKAYSTVTSVVNDEGKDPQRANFQYQVAGWPPDWQRQLAVALDTPIDTLARIAIGGPLPVADLMGVSVNDSLPFFTRVIES